MRSFPVLALLAVTALGTVACSQTESQAPASQPSSSTAMRSGSPEDEQACLNYARAEMQTDQISIVSSEFSQANTEVIVAVGDQRAQWRCLVSGAVVAEFMSLTNEGAL